MNLLERKRTIDDLRGFAEAISVEKTEQYLRTDLGPDLGFQGLEEEFRAIHEAAARVSEANLAVLPGPIASTGLTAFVNADAVLKQVERFNIVEIAKQGRDPTPLRRDLFQQAQDTIRSSLNQLAPVFAYLAAEESRSQTEIADEKLAHSVKRAEAAALQMDALAADAARTQSEIQHVLETSRQSLQKVGVSQHSVHFKEQADEHQASATNWLLATALAGTLTLISAIVNMWWANTHAITGTPGQFGQIIIAKVFIFSVLVSATLWCGRVFRAHRHNQVVNRHRQNALSSFETFVASSTDDSTRNAVLVQATQAVFQPQHSGFSSTDADPNAPSVIDIIRTLPATK